MFMVNRNTDQSEGVFWRLDNGYVVSVQWSRTITPEKNSPVADVSVWSPDQQQVNMPEMCCEGIAHGLSVNQVMKLMLRVGRM